MAGGLTVTARGKKKEQTGWILKKSVLRDRIGVLPRLGARQTGSKSDDLKNDLGIRERRFIKVSITHAQEGLGTGVSEMRTRGEYPPVRRGPSNDRTYVWARVRTGAGDVRGSASNGK